MEWKVVCSMCSSLLNLISNASLYALPAIIKVITDINWSLLMFPSAFAMSQTCG